MRSRLGVVGVVRFNAGLGATKVDVKADTAKARAEIDTVARDRAWWAAGWVHWADSAAVRSCAVRFPRECAPGEFMPLMPSAATAGPGNQTINAPINILNPVGQDR